MYTWKPLFEVLVATSTLAKNIKLKYELNTQRKDIEKREDALNDWFKAQSGGANADFVHDKLIVAVTEESRTSLDGAALRQELGDKIKKFEKTTSFKKVSVRKAG